MPKGAKQTVIVKKTAAPTRREAGRIARRFADRIYTSRYDRARREWRFRQRPPGCFVKSTFRTWCKPGKDVCVVYGRLKKGAEKRSSCR